MCYTSCSYTINIGAAMEGATQKEPFRSQAFDDVYFSAADGLAESRHVFLQGNDLPKRWAGRGRFTIAETGFGTGLNFLAAWKLFEETAQAGQRLDFISFEKYPLEAAEISVILADWAGEFPGQLAALCARYPVLVPGFHKIFFDERVSLTLIIDDVNAALPQLTADVDCWFLDGFKPSTNPEMWSPVVFENMARLSAPGASFATFTAAGEVRRGLSAAGFDVRKVKGFGTKRDMLVGVYGGA